MSEVSYQPDAGLEDAVSFGVEVDDFVVESEVLGKEAVFGEGTVGYYSLVLQYAVEAAADRLAVRSAKLETYGGSAAALMGSEMVRMVATDESGTVVDSDTPVDTGPV